MNKLNKYLRLFSIVLLGSLLSSCGTVAVKLVQSQMDNSIPRYMNEKGFDPLKTCSKHVIVDTDSNFDDQMAIILLLNEPSVCIDAIIVTEGAASVDGGYTIIRQLLSTLGQEHIDVIKGRSNDSEYLLAQGWREPLEKESLIVFPKKNETRERNINGVEYLLQVARSSSKPDLVLLSTWTTIAETKRQFEESDETVPFFSKFGEIYFTGGQIYSTSFSVTDNNILLDVNSAVSSLKGYSSDKLHFIPLDLTGYDLNNNHYKETIGFDKKFTNELFSLAKAYEFSDLKLFYVTLKTEALKQSDANGFVRSQDVTTISTYLRKDVCVMWEPLLLTDEYMSQLIDNQSTLLEREFISLPTKDTPTYCHGGNQSNFESIINSFYAQTDLK